jgi:hypothetical protein
MLIYTIKLAFFAAVSIFIAGAANYKFFSSSLGKRVILFWLLVIPFLFIIRNELLSMSVFALLLFYFNRDNKSHAITIAYFIAVLGAGPDWSKYIVSVPGINYLIRLSFEKVMVIVLLVPIFLQLRTISRVQWNLTDTFVCVFFIFTVLLTFRADKITIVLRFVMDSLLIYVIPYFVISRVVKSVSDLHYCALGYLALAFLLAGVFIVSQSIQVDIYNALDPYDNFHSYKERRGVFLRLSGPFFGVLVGFLMLAGYLSLEILKKYEVNKHIPLWLFFAVCILCVVMGGSRGAFVGFSLGVGSYFYFVKLTGIKRMLVVLMMIFLFLSEYIFDVSSFFQYEDEYGTFDYRAELYLAAWEFMKEQPFLGHQNYLVTGHFDHLITGLGIIDIVSAYLQFALLYGYVGLFLFVGMFLSVITPLFFYLQNIKNQNDYFFKYVAMYFALNIAAIFIISTTSIISFFPIFLMINLAIGRALCSKNFLKHG